MSDSRPVTLFPKRRGTDDQKDGNAIGRLLTFTDLMAILLCFFILVYSTHDPRPVVAQKNTQDKIPSIVAPSPANKAMFDAKQLNQGRNGLDLNYVAALLRQAQTRDDMLQGIEIASYEYALGIALPDSDVKKLQAIIDRLVSYNRNIEVFAAPATLEQITTLITQTGSIRYFPQERVTPLLLVH